MTINCVSGNDELYSKELVTDSISGGWLGSTKYTLVQGKNWSEPKINLSNIIQTFKPNIIAKGACYSSLIRKTWQAHPRIACGTSWLARGFPPLPHRPSGSISAPHSPYWAPVPLWWSCTPCHSWSGSRFPPFPPDPDRGCWARCCTTEWAAPPRLRWPYSTAAMWSPPPSPLVPLWQCLGD